MRSGNDGISRKTQRLRKDAQKKKQDSGKRAKVEILPLLRSRFAPLRDLCVIA
jgi:hypothetical protein